MKEALLFIALVSAFTSYCQQAEIIVVDSLNGGHYIDFESDSDGNLYLLNQYNTFSKITLSGELLASDTYNCGFVCRFTDAEVAQDGTVYFTSDTDGLFRRESDNTLTNILDERISSVAIDNNGIVAVLGNAPSANFIFQVFENDVWTEYTTENTPFESSWTYDLQVDANNTFWIAGQDGLFSFKDGVFQNYTTEQIYNIRPNSNGDLTVAYGSESIGIIKSGESSVDKIPWQEATGNFATLNKYGTLYITDGEDVFIRKNDVWTEYDLDDIGATGFIGRQMYIDDGGNVFYSLDGESVIYYWESQLVDVKGISLKEEVELYPNPAVSNLIISTDKDISAISIYNQYGSLVDQRSANDSEIVLDVTEYTNGIYLIKVITSEGIGTKTFAISH